MTVVAELWRGQLRETPALVLVEVLDGGFGRVPCPECEGTGWWAYAEPEVPGAPCVDCKGQGRLYVAL